MKFWPSNTSDQVARAMATMLAALLIASCAATGTTPRATPTGVAPAGADACRAAIQEATRLHNAAVELVNAQRAELALNSFDQAIEEWQRVTGGALSCPRDLVTQANDGLQRTQFERDRALNPPR